MNHNFTDKQNSLINSNPEFKEIIESSYPEVRDFKYWGSTMGDVHYLIKLISEGSFYNNSSSLTLTTTNITQLISSVLKSYEKINTSKNVEFILNINDEIPLITADETKLKQIFINLIKNAYESLNLDNPKSFIMINLNCNSNSISIEIKDNGCCITSEQLPNIFLPLVSYKQDGTGLGLPISKKIIEAHKGTISVISEDNYTFLYYYTSSLIYFSENGNKTSNILNVLKFPFAVISPVIKARWNVNLPLIILSKDSVDNFANTSTSKVFSYLHFNS